MDEQQTKIHELTHLMLDATKDYFMSKSIIDRINQNLRDFGFPDNKHMDNNQIQKFVMFVLKKKEETEFLTSEVIRIYLDALLQTKTRRSPFGELTILSKTQQNQQQKPNPNEFNLSMNGIETLTKFPSSIK
jgi:hypothetical protein